MGQKGKENSAAPRIPEPDGPVGAARGNVPAIRAVRHRANVIRVSTQRLNWNAGIGIPNSYGAIDAPGGNMVPIGSESHAQDSARMSTQRAKFLSGLGVPYFRGLVKTG